VTSTTRIEDLLRELAPTSARRRVPPPTAVMVRSIAEA
jgi:hypothetical protein